MDNTFKSYIDSANGLLLILPQDPVFDEVTAACALSLTLKGQKDASIYSPTPIIVEFNRIIGVDKIQNSLNFGNKNLTITLKDYKGEDVDKVGWDVENSVFKLTIVPQEGKTSPKKENVNIEDAGTKADTVILIGGDNPNQFPIAVSPDLKDAKIIHVGFKAVTVNNGKESLSFARNASSTSEVLANLIKEAGWGIDADIATNLVSGIEAETAAFTSQYVSADTFQMVADLIRAGGKKGGALPQIPKGQYPQGALPQNMMPKMTPQQQFAQMGQYFNNQQPGQGVPQGQPMPQVQDATYAQPQQQGQVQPQTQKQEQPTEPVQPIQQQPMQQGPQQQTQQSQTVPQGQPAPQAASPENAEYKEPENPPEEWLSTPKIYKGTSV